MSRLRTLRRSDLPEVLRVQRSAYAPAFHEPSETFAAKLSLYPSGALGCFDGESLVAYIFCHPWTLGEVVLLNAGTLQLPERSTCLYIHDLAVSPDHRGRGVASRLAYEAGMLAWKIGMPACALVAVQGSEPFWERLGFVGKHKLEYRPGIKATYMVREKL